MNSFQSFFKSGGSRIGLGLAALGRPGYITLGHANDLREAYDPEAMEAGAHLVLEAAYDSGVRYFDAAQSYGRAEEFLSSWLRKKGFGAGELLVGSKWGYTYTADWKVEAERHEVKSHSLDVLSQQWRSSQSRLEPWMDLYQIHSATFDSGVLENIEVLEALEEIKAQGILVGLSLSGPNQAAVLDKAMEVIVKGEPLFGVVQATFNILEQAAAGSLQKAHEKGWVVIIKEALANGRLTDKNIRESFQGKMNILKQEARLLHTTVDALALAYVLHHPWVDIVLSGAARVDHLESNLKAEKLHLDSTHLSRLGRLKEESTTYWATRKQLAWN